VLTATACSASDVPGVEGEEGDRVTAADIAGPMERDGSLDLETAQDTFDRTYAKAIDVAERFDAEVVDAATDQQPYELPTGSLTLSVPDDRYTDVLTAMSELGRVRSQRIEATRREVTSEAATPAPDGATEQPATISRLVVTISEPRNLANTVRSTWGIARNVMLYSVQAVMLLVAFAIPFLIVIVLVRLGVSGWRRLVGAAKERRPRPNDRADRPEPPSAERPPSDDA
jgi:hypothetical protein